MQHRVICHPLTSHATENEPGPTSTVSRWGKRRKSEILQRERQERSDRTERRGRKEGMMGENIWERKPIRKREQPRERGNIRGREEGKRKSDRRRDRKMWRSDKEMWLRGTRKRREFYLGERVPKSSCWLTFPLPLNTFIWIAFVCLSLHLCVCACVCVSQ